MTKKQLVLLQIVVILSVNVFIPQNLLAKTILQPSKSISSYDSTPYNTTLIGGLGAEGSVFADTDENGNLIVTCFTESLDYIGKNIMTLKYDNNMTLLWNQTWINKDDAQPAGIAIDSENNIIVSGTIITEISPSTFSHNVFIIKYSSDGVKLWNETTLTANQDDDAASVAVNSTGSIFIVGHTNSSEGSLFLQNYNPEGTYLRTNYYGITSPRELVMPNGITIDEKDNIFVAGSSDNTNPPANLNDLVIIKFNSNGNAKWNVTFGGSNPIHPDEWGYDVAVADEEIYLVGNLFDVDTNEPDAVIVKLDYSGNILWNATLNFAVDTAYSVIINHKGNPVFAGDTNYQDTNGNIFLAEYNPDGIKLWNSTWNSGQADQNSDLCFYNNFTHTIGISFNLDTTSNDISIVTFVDPTWDPNESLSTIPIGWKIFTYILSILAAIFAIFVIGVILYTYFEKTYFKK